MTIRRWAGLLAAAGVLMIGLPGVAQAAAAPASTQTRWHDTVVTTTGTTADREVSRAEMTLDCTHMSQSVHQYAVAHQYCPQQGPDSASPDSRLPGNCGTSEIWIDSLGGGWASITYGFNSTNGTVVHRDLAIGWAGEDEIGGWSDRDLMASASYFAGNQVWTGVGEAYTQLSGTVTLWWGGHCTLLEPGDQTFVD